jgi:hypothetical protein
MNDGEPDGQINPDLVAKYFTYEEFGFICVMFDMRRFLMVRKVQNDDGTVQYLLSKFVMYQDKHKEQGATRYVISPVLYVGLSFKVRDYFKTYPYPTYALHSQEYDDKYASYFFMMPPPRPPHTAPPQYQNQYLEGYLWASRLSPEKFEEFLESIGGLINTKYHIQD